MAIDWSLIPQLSKRKKKLRTLQNKFIFLLITICCVPFLSWLAVMLWELQVCLALSQNNSFKQASRCRNCNLIPNCHTVMQSKWTVFFWSSLRMLYSLNSTFLSSENKCKWAFSPSTYLSSINFWKRNVDCVTGWYLSYVLLCQTKIICYIKWDDVLGGMVENNSSIYDCKITF